MPAQHVLVCAAAVGAALTIAYGIVHAVLMAVAPVWSMGHAGMAAGVFLAGAASYAVADYYGGVDRLCAALGSAGSDSGSSDSSGSSGSSGVIGAAVEAL